MTVFSPKPEKQIYRVGYQAHLLQALPLILVIVSVLLVLFFMGGWLWDRIVDSHGDFIEAHLPLEKVSENFFSYLDLRESEDLQARIDDFDLTNSYQVRVWCHSEVNAFAVPGNLIILTSEILNVLKTEGALDFVLAHEIAHFLHYDHIRGLGRQIISSFLVSIFGFSVASEQLSYLVDFKFSRRQESLADSVALQILYHSSGHLGGADEFFRYLLKEKNEKESRFKETFRTHPNLASRLAEVERQQEIFGIKESPQIKGDWMEVC